MKIGIFGGAFDPFHNEHRKIIVAAHDELNLDKVVVTPSFLPPHKHGEISSYAARREMVAVGTEGLDYVLIDDLEEERGCVNPTSVTLPLLKSKYPCDDFCFIMGGDSAVNFSSWIEPKKITDCARIAVVARSGCGDIEEAVKKIREEYNADITILRYCGEWVSSSRIKALSELGYEIEGVSEAVAETIKKYNLYRHFSDLLEELKKDLTPNTYEHCASVAVYAENFAGMLKLKFEDVFLACMLHDCAKNSAYPMEGISAPVVHQFRGAEIARAKYGITDDNVLDAIRYHTSGKPNMTNLGKLVYCADMLEPRRNFAGVEDLREIISKDFEAGFIACVNATYEHLLNSDKPIYPLTKDCVEYYNKREDI